MARNKANELERAYIILNEKGLTSKELAKKLGLTIKTVEGIRSTQPVTDKQAVEIPEEVAPIVEVKKENKLKGKITYKTDKDRKVSMMTQGGSEMLDDLRSKSKSQKFDPSYMGKPYPEEV